MKGVLVAIVALFVVASVPGLATTSDAPQSPTADADGASHGLSVMPPPGEPTIDLETIPIPDGYRQWGDVHNQCGDVRLVFKNPDLQEDEQGIITASGGFFIQFQAVVPSDQPDLASKITRLGFSFFQHVDQVESSPLSCNDSIPENMAGSGLGGGAYLLYYRSDFDPSDGFFVPLFTFLVPDGDYGAAIHAYAEESPGACAQYGNPQCVEVARGWAKAIVDNCSDDPQNHVSASALGGCPADKGTADCLTAPYGQAAGYSCDRDAIVPWPMILPGDGQQTNGVNGITVDFAELIQRDTLRISLNGRALPDCKADGAPQDDCWDEYASPRQYRDADLVPTNDNQECKSPGTENPEGIKGVCERIKYGPGFSWEGTVNPGDVIRVEAKDMKGNLVQKTAGYGHATSGGVVFLEAPEVAIDAPQGDSVEIRPGDTHEFNLRVVNIGNGDAHTSLLLNHTSKDPTFAAYWADADGAKSDHAVIPADGLEHFLKVVVTTKADSVETFGSTPPYQLNATIQYDAEGLPQERKLNLFVKVSHEASAEHEHLHKLLDEDADMKEKEEQEKINATSSKKGDSGLLPGFDLVAFAGAVAVAVSVAEAGRRRRKE